MTRGRNNRRKKPARKLRMRTVKVDWRAIGAAVVGGLLIGIAALGAKSALDQPVTRLSIEGAFQRVTAPQIEAALADDLARGFLSLSLDQLTASLKSLDWIDDVRIRRSWPDQIAVSVTEQTAAARWGESGLLNVRGELFATASPHPFPELPELNGPSGSERQVATYYLELRGRLLESRLALESLSMDPRGALEFELATGQVVRFGRQEINQRMNRFFSVVVPALRHDFDRIAYIDMRYTNGFSVGWLDARGPEQLDPEELHASG